MDILKHYLSSVLIYGLTLLFVTFCPLLNQNIQNPYFNYITILSIYYFGYVIFAYPILLKLKPQNSRNITILNYIKRQFKKTNNLEEQLKNIEPDEDEKQAFVILFVKAFFGVWGLNLLCNQYLPMLGYNFDFIKTMFVENFITNSWNFIQFLEDTQDIWLSLIFTVTTFVLTISYITESKLFGNKIKYADTTPLGILTCAACYYPLIMFTNKLLPMSMGEIMPVDNFYLRIFLYSLAIMVNFISMIAILRLGTKSGNLTNRGIVTGFPYNIVRHPDYSMQILYIILTALPIYFMNEVALWHKILGTSGIILWIYLYYLRALTEERNLIKDEQYLDYTNKVKYRFIPKLF